MPDSLLTRFNKVSAAINKTTLPTEYERIAIAEALFLPAYVLSSNEKSARELRRYYQQILSEWQYNLGERYNDYIRQLKLDITQHRKIYDKEQLERMKEFKLVAAMK